MKTINTAESGSVVYTLHNGVELEVTCIEMVGEEISYHHSDTAFSRALACYVALSNIDERRLNKE